MIQKINVDQSCSFGILDLNIECWTGDNLRLLKKTTNSIILLALVNPSGILDIASFWLWHLRTKQCIRFRQCVKNIRRSSLCRILLIFCSEDQPHFTKKGKFPEPLKQESLGCLCWETRLEPRIQKALVSCVYFDIVIYYLFNINFIYSTLIIPCTACRCLNYHSCMTLLVCIHRSLMMINSSELWIWYKEWGNSK